MGQSKLSSGSCSVIEEDLRVGKECLAISSEVIFEGLLPCLVLFFAPGAAPDKLRSTPLSMAMA